MRNHALILITSLWYVYNREIIMVHFLPTFFITLLALNLISKKLKISILSKYHKKNKNHYDEVNEIIFLHDLWFANAHEDNKNISSTLLPSLLSSS